MSEIKIECPSCQQSIEIAAPDEPKPRNSSFDRLVSKTFDALAPSMEEPRREEIERKARRVDRSARAFDFIGGTFFVLGFVVGIPEGRGHPGSLIGVEMILSAIGVTIVFHVLARLAKIHASIIRLQK